MFHHFQLLLFPALYLHVFCPYVVNGVLKKCEFSVGKLIVGFRLSLGRGGQNIPQNSTTHEDVRKYNKHFVMIATSKTSLDRRTAVRY